MRRKSDAFEQVAWLTMESTPAGQSNQGISDKGGGATGKMIMKPDMV
jgi:hypothetical protein